MDQQAVSAAQELHPLPFLHAAPDNPHQHAAVPAACVDHVAPPDTALSIKATTTDTAVSPLLATPPVEPEQQESNPTSEAKEAAPVSQSQVSTTKKTSPDPETKRKMQILFNRADKITEGYSMNHKIAYSGCQGQIQDNFWTKIRMKPLEYFVEEKVDDDKIKETYKVEARALGVRIY